MPRRLSAALRQNLLLICNNNLVLRAVTAAAQGSKHTSAAALVSLLAASGAFAADLKPDGQAPSGAEPSAYGWTGFYLGGHMGYAWGNSNWAASAAPGQAIAAGSFGLAQPIDTFDEAGSFFGGVQIGYNYLLANRMVIGAEADVSLPAFPDPAGLTIGGISPFSSHALGAESYSENVFASGTVRARIGYAPGSWLYFATGGLAWTSDQFTLTQLSSGNAQSAFMARLGWAAGAGVEGPLIPNWTVRLEYLYTGYGNSGMNFAQLGQRTNSDLSVQEVRVGVNYQFGTAASEKDSPAPRFLNADGVSFHGQFTGAWQGYPAIKSPYQGTNSLPGGGEARETTDLTLYAGFRLWQGAELWVDPELDQGFGAADTHGASGFPSGESYKLGQAEPYARVQRYFVRQTIDLGGETQKVDDDLNQFAGSTTADRLVLTIGKLAIVDIFDTNKYANNPKIDFLNWAAINTGTFDYAGDAWGFTYGAAAEWYTGRWTLRGGIFDLSQTPAGGDSPLAYGLDPTFSQFQLVGEIEERHDLWGQPGKLKVTGFLQDGRMGAFKDAILLSQATGQPADINAVRTWHSRPGVSFNMEQQVTSDIGVFARAGWLDGRYEPWDFTDTDRTVQAGVSISGTRWGRPDDRVGIMGIFNGITGVHAEFFNLGGLGILVGDGDLVYPNAGLPHPGWEKILETYYSYSLSTPMKLSADYQFIANPGFNTDRGPANLFAGRVHWQF